MKKNLLLFGLIGVLFTSCFDDDSTLNEESCDCRSKIIVENDFNTLETSTYTILDVHINENCLDITISSSGCDPKSWGMDLVSTDAFYSVNPLKRAVKIKLTNDQACLAVFKKQNRLT